MSENSVGYNYIEQQYIFASFALLSLCDFSACLELGFDVWAGVIDSFELNS